MGKNNKNVYTNKNGDPVMRVTEVVGILAKEQLVFWANMLGFKRVDYRKELNRAANIGNAIHDLIEQITDPTKLARLQPDERYNLYHGTASRTEFDNALNSFMLWYKNLSVPYKVLYQEHKMIGDKLGGTADCVIKGIHDKDKVIIVDYKTSGGLYLSMYLQLAAYVGLYEENYGEGTVEGVMVVRMDKKHGKPAEASLIERKELDPFMECLDNLIEVATATKKLDKTFKTKIWEVT